MSTPPKEPKPEDARRAGAATLEHTYLGVAPTIPPDQTAAAGGAPAAGGAIIAAPMISVSDRAKQGAALPAAAPVAPAVATAPPARPTGLQGGWQSAGIPRAPGPEQTVLHGTPGAWPMPPLGTPTSPAQQVTTPQVTAPQVTAPQVPTAPQRIEPQVVTAPQRVEPQWFTAPPRPETPAAPRVASPSPTAGGGLQHTALASDYLRGARDVAFSGGAAAPAAHWPVAPAQPTEAGRQTAYSPVSTPEPPRAHWQEPTLPTQTSMSHFNVSAASGAHAPAPPTIGPPPTAELSSPAPIPLPSPQPSVPVFYGEPDSGHGLRGTQASVAPPPKELTASFHAPMPPVLQQAAPVAAPVAAQVPLPAAQAPLAAALMAPVASPVRQAVPQGLAGTMLDRTPSIPGGALPQGSPPPPANPTLRFEQVPAPRSSLAQQATAFGLNIPIDPQATQWGRPGAEAKAKGRPNKGGQKPSQLRMIGLAFLALLSALAAAFGPELRVWVESRSARGPQGTPVAGVADQATLTNLPSSSANRSTPGATETTAANPSAANPSAAPAATAVAEPTAAVGDAPAAAIATGTAAPTTPSVEATAIATSTDVEPATTKGKRGRKDRNAQAARETATLTPAESRQAAEAGRHVLAARYAEALPLYRSLQRDYPQNTAYAAMTKVLEQKVGGTKQEGAQP